MSITTNTNFIAGRMNKSVDERLIPEGEYIDALNVRLGSTENTEIGAVENSKGNTLLTELEYKNGPLSENARTIGVWEDGIYETLYWFVHDSSNPFSPTGVVDLIVSYNTTTGVLIYHCISTSVLNFSPKYLITGVNKIENLLFFTDDYNAPRCINVSRDYAYPNAAGADVLIEEDINVIKQPPGFESYNPAIGQIRPLPAPKLEYDPEYASEENYMENKFISFAYRYRYKDGEYSATSLFTQPAFQPGQYKFSVTNFNNAGMQNRYNKVDVVVSTGSSNVVEVDILYKESTSNVIYVVKRFDKKQLTWSDNDFHTHTFTNEEIYTTLGSDELLRLYDNVPRYAKAQTIQGNRLIYGNYVDGYNLTRAGGTKIQVEYAVEPFSEEIEGVELGNGGSSSGGATPNPVVANANYNIGPAASIPVTVTDSKVTWDLTSAVNAGLQPVPLGTTFNFSFSITQQDIKADTIAGAPDQADFLAYTQNGLSPFDITMTYTTGQIFNTLDDMLEHPTFLNRIGGSVAQGFGGAPTDPLFAGLIQELYPCNNTNQGGTLSDKFYREAQATVSTSTPSKNYTLISGSVTNQCPTPVAGWPITCSSLPLFTSVTNCDPATTACSAGNLTVHGVDFTTIIAGGVLLGDIITLLTPSPGFNLGAQATVTDITNAATGVLGVTDVLATDPAIATAPAIGGLSDTAMNFQITRPGGTAPCAPDGFVYEGPTALGVSNKFSLQIPATQYYADDGAGNQGDGFIYYRFNVIGCEGAYLKTDNQFSLHSNRDYEVGLVYMDKYARSSTVLTSDTSTAFFPASTAGLQNKLQVVLENEAPYWATHYKFVVKPSAGAYNTLFSNLFYIPDGNADLKGGDTGTGSVLSLPEANSRWFKLEGANQNIVKAGDTLIVKRDSEGNIEDYQRTEVLAVEAFSGNAINEKSFSGLYMKLNPDGWAANLLPDATYFRERSGTNSGPSCGSISNSCITVSLNDNASPSQPYTIPAGSIIRVYLNNWRGRCSRKCDRKKLVYDQTFVSTSNYSSFYEWAIGDDLQGRLNINSADSVEEMGLTFNTTLSAGTGCGGSCFTTRCQIAQNALGEQFFANSYNIRKCCCWACTDQRPGHGKIKIEVTRSGGAFVFETEPQEADPNLFYDASDMMEIENGNHLSKYVLNPDHTAWLQAPLNVDQDLASGTPMITYLDAANCYTFGNGVESMKILDSPVAKSFNLGERVLAVSNQDYKEADRFAGLTYSGTFSGPANSNNLNEFNLGLVNFKDCETAFGPIMKLHARETDILTLQEDRITYVLADKNVITDSTGGGAIASVPEVLGTQIARIEEYGISYNPESFASYGSDMYFTDAKRGVVVNLRGAGLQSDQLQVVSRMGMNSWFRNQFNQHLNSQKLGGYDPYMNEYVLGNNGKAIPVPVPEVPCGRTICQNNTSTNQTFDIDLGLVVGLINVDYTITSGSITLSIDWNGNITNAGPFNTSGNTSFNKTLNTPTTATVNVAVAPNTSYCLTVDCPPEIKLNVIQVVINSPDVAGQNIHTDYQWTDGFNTSFWTGISPSVLKTALNQPAEWVSNTGIRSLGPFPYDGTDIKLRTRKISPDNFDLNIGDNKFKILSSNTLYGDNIPDMNALLADPGLVTFAPPFSSPAADYYQAVATAFNMPLVNKYLYLVWDLRTVTSADMCYCSNPATATDVCCTCVNPCTKCYWSPVQFSIIDACSVDVDTPGGNSGGFTGSGSLPEIGDFCDSPTNTSCSFGITGYRDAGYYIVSAVSPSVGPKVWVEVNANGVVIDKGTC